MTKTELTAGMVVQLDPTKCGNKAFAGCFMVITEPKAFGAQGYIQGVGETREERGIGGQYYYRANWAEMEFVGHAVWTLGGHADE
jgi:hypothetical protein